MNRSSDFSARQRAARHGSRFVMCLATAVVTCGLLASVVAHAQPVPGTPLASPPDATRATTPLSDIPHEPVSPTPESVVLAEHPDVQAYYEAARDLVERRDFVSALAQLDAALSLPGGLCFEVLHLLALTQQGLGQDGQARLAAEHAALIRPGDPEVECLLGRLARSHGRLEAAINHFHAAGLARYQAPDSALVTAAWYELGNCLVEAGYLLAAVEAFETFDNAIWVMHPEHRIADEVAPILALHPHGAVERRLELLDQLQRPTDRVRVSREALDVSPDDAYLQRLYARTLLEAGDAARAFEFCRRRIEEETEPTAGEIQAPEASGGTALLSLAVEAAQAAGAFDAWVADLQADLAQGRRVNLVRRMAQLLDKSGAFAQSVPLWRMLVAAHPNAAADAWALASALKGVGRLADALDSLIDFVRRNPDDADIPAGRLAAWMRSFEQTDEFLALVPELTARETCDQATYTVLGVTAAAAGQPELAERLFRAAVQGWPEFALAHVAWGRTELAAYRWDAARAHAEAALALRPDLVAANLLLGEAFTGLDESAAAEAAYKAAVKERPYDPDCLVALAQHCQRAGDWLAAQRYLQDAWSHDATRADVLEELVEAYLGGGKLEIARACLQEAEAGDIPADTLRRLRTALDFATQPLGPAHLAELRRQSGTYPDDGRTGLKLAAGLYVKGEVSQALEVLEKLPAHSTDETQIMFLEARIRLRRLETDKAISVLEELARRYPRRESVLALLAQALLSDFRVPEARDSLQRLVTLDIDADQRDHYRAQLLATYVDFMDYDAALQTVDAWANETPEGAAWTRAKLRVLLTAGRDAEAVALAQARLAPATERFDALAGQLRELAARVEAEPDDTALQAQGRALERDLGAALQAMYEQQGEYVQVCTEAEDLDEAERAVREWLAARPEDPQYQEWLIEILLDREKAAEAMEAVAQFTPPDLANVADLIKLCTWRARCYALTDRIDEAVTELSTLLEKPFIQANTAARVQVRQVMLTLMIHAHDYSLAVKRCDTWLADSPGDPAAEYEILSLKRLVLQAAEREAEQVAVSERLLALQPRDPGLNNDLGYTWVERGEHLDRALEMIRTAVAAEPLNAAYLDSLGWAHYKRGEFDAARRYLSRAVRLLDGQDPILYDHLGDAECRLDDLQAAAGHWRKALAMIEEDTDADPDTRHAELIASLRGKLAALERSEPPSVAPQASEPGSEDPS